jgi:hypothetical protein
MKCVHEYVNGCDAAAHRRPGIQAEQLGFNPNNCGSDAIYGLVEGIKYSRNKGMYVVASCDISKAYPKMHRGHMLNLARKAGA